MKKPSKKTLKNKLRLEADKLLQQYVKIKYKGILCYSCGNKSMVVGHHYIPVSNSLALRYYLPNLIPLCKECHCLVHTQPHLVNPKIDFFMGKEWYEDLMEEKRRGAKFTLEWIQTKLKVLTELKEER